MARENHLYAIGGDNQPIKIGLAACPSQRLIALQTGNPYKLRVLYQQASPYAVYAETMAHGLVDQHKLSGEWFRITPEEAEAAIRWALWFYEAYDGKPPFGHIDWLREQAGLTPVIDPKEQNRQMCRKLFACRSPEDYEKALGYG